LHASRIFGHFPEIAGITSEQSNAIPCRAPSCAKGTDGFVRVEVNVRKEDAGHPTLHTRRRNAITPISRA
jgi:hypothetical protein